MSFSHFKLVWLSSLCVLILILIFIGGLTRLTGSGLSMVTWQPVQGIIPPLSSNAWEKALQDYKQSPEGQIINAKITLKRFKFIFYMEYLHRMFGRLIGLWTLLPCAFLIARRQVSKKEGILFCCLSFLVVVQGIVGWLMVKSGLSQIPQVSHLRLTLHLLLACLFLAFAQVLALNSLEQKTPLKIDRIQRAWLIVIGIFIVLQFAYGGLMAGSKAASISNTFPKMNGQWIPMGLFVFNDFWTNFIHNPILIHFIHRALGILLLSLAWTHYIWILCSKKQRSFSKEVLFAEHLFIFLMTLQVVFGILLVVSQSKILLPLIHQLWAVLTGMTWLFLLHRNSFFGRRESKIKPHSHRLQ